MKILVIDDDKSYLDMIDEILSQYGIEVLKTNNFFDAEKLLFSEKPDKVLVDVIMPLGNGVDFIRKHSIKTNSEFWLLTGDLEHPSVIDNLSKGSIILSGIILKTDLINGLMGVAGERRYSKID